MSKYGEQIGRIDERTEHIVKRVDSIDIKLDKLNGTVDTHVEKIARLEERQGILAGIQGTFTMIAAGLAAWIGLQK